MLTAAVALSLASGCADNLIEGEGPILTDEREVDYFRSVKVSGGIHVDLADAPFAPLEVSTHANLWEYVETVVIDETLIIRPVSDVFLFPAQPIEVAVSAPDIDTLQLGGGSKVFGSASCEDEGGVLVLDASGGSELELTDVDTGLVDVTASGGSRMNVTGDAEAVRAELSGGSQAQLLKLEAVTANVDLSGGSQATLNVLGTVGGSLSGGSRLELFGDPITDLFTSGGSEIILLVLDDEDLADDEEAP